jgi:hypothetical protein
MTPNEPISTDLHEAMGLNKLIDENRQKAKKQLTQSIITGLVMLGMTFIAGVLIGYFFFEAHIVERLNTQFESMGMGLCNITQTYITVDENAQIFLANKTGALPIE